MNKLLLKNATIIDMKNGIPQKKDILINHSIIDKIDESINDASYDTLNLEGCTIVPGFFDSHVHLVPTIINESAINLSNATSIDEILSLIQNKREKNPELKIILGTHLTEFSLEHKQLPTKEELDTVAPDIPVFLSSTEFHTITVNSFALHKLKLPLTIDRIIKNDAGVPTGQLKNEASIYARKKMYEMIPETYQKKNLEIVQNKIIKKGVTSIIAIEGGYLFHNKHVDYLLKNKNKFAFDISILFSTTNLQKIKAYQLNKIGGDIFLDGSFASRNAAVSKPYSDSKNEKGKLFFTQAEIEELIEDAIKSNLQISIHAVGDIGIEKLLDAYETVFKKYPTIKSRHKIEHFELPKDEHIKRAGELGLILTMHPTYEYFFREKNGMYENRLGKERALQTNPFRKIYDEKIIVAGGSDSNVMPVDPLLGIHAAVNHPNKTSRITPYEALQMYTINGAYGNFEEKTKGTIEEGKKADLAILSANPMTCDPDTIKDIDVLYTIKNGRIVYQSR